MALREDLVLKVNGLYTYSDQLSEVPEGSLRRAVNVVIDKDGLISPRRGYENLAGTLPGNLNEFFTYNYQGFNYLLAHYDNANLARYDDNTDTWTAYTTGIAKPANAEAIRSAKSNKNIYFTSDQGIQKLDSLTGDLADAGAPEGLDFKVTLAASAGANWFTTNNQVAYRHVWAYEDANKNLVLGAPSSPLTVINSGADTATSIEITLPAESLKPGWFVQVYRTNLSGGVSVSPGDSMQLALEYTITSGDISTGYITLTDTTSDEFLGADLYTNATQQGILQANYQPPQAVDIALFQNYMFFAATETTYSIQVTLLGAKATSPTSLQLTVDDTVTINGVVYTAKATETIANNEFAVADTASAASNIESTARSLVRVINRSASNSTIWAVYDSGAEELPGQIRIFERDFGTASNFTFISSRGGAWSPNSTAAVTSTNDDKPNRLFFSKFQQPEAVPITNYLDVGAANDKILRILPLRSILLIFTTAGIYKLNGTTQSSFSVTLLDDTAKLIAPRSLVSLNNSAVGLFDQGVSQVTYSAVQVLSRPIEGELNEIRGDTPSTLEPYCFGISYESDRKYIMGIPTTNTSTQADKFYVFNTVTRSWTVYDLAKKAGIVREQDDKLYFGSLDAVIVERKNFDETDYVEPSFNVTVNSVTGTVLAVASTSGILPGYQYYEDSSKFSTIQSVDALNSTITVLDDLTWSTGSFEVRPYIQTDIEWNPALAGSPNLLKQFSEVTLLVNKPIQEATISFKTLTSSDFEDVTLVDNSIGLWGLFEWGQVPWGGSTTVYRYRTYVPKSKQRDSALVLRLRQNTVYNDFEISGWSIIFRTISNRVTR